MPSTSQWMLCAEGCKSLMETALEAITPPIDGANMHIQKTPWKTGNLAAPGVLIVPVDETNTAVTNKRDDVGHGVGIIIFQAGNRDTTSTNLDRLSVWRDAAKTALRAKRILAADCHMIDIEPRVVVDEAAFQNQYDVTSFVARCHVRSL